MKKVLLLICISCFTLPSFAQTNQVKFVFDHQVNGAPLTIGTTEFDIWNEKAVMLTRAEFYISEIALTADDDSVVPLTDINILVDANDGDLAYEVGEWEISSVKNVVLHVGVDEAHNHLDPSTYPADHPLAPQNPSMHWGWTAGYRFLAVEGKVDNNSDGILESLYQYHNLGDNLYYNTTLNGLAVAENGELVIHITLDYANLFKNIALTGNLIHHGSDSENKLMLDNSVHNDFFTMDGANAAHEVLANSGKVKVLPNPANLSTVVRYGFPETYNDVNLVITNMFGQEMARFQHLPATSNQEVGTADFPSGLFMAAFYSADKLIARKQIQVSH